MYTVYTYAHLITKVEKKKSIQNFIDWLKTGAELLLEGKQYFVHQKSFTGHFNCEKMGSRAGLGRQNVSKDKTKLPSRVN